MPDTVAVIQSIYADLSERVDELSFRPPVTHVCNPLAYAREPAWHFLARAGGARGRLLLLGMNPGPYGMVQTGVPFGTVGRVRGWLGIEAPVGKPVGEHPKRPVSGFDCRREEVSGERFWGWAEERFGTPARFFERIFVANYCPLVFMEASGRNRTPDKLPATERRSLFDACDEALEKLVDVLEPRAVIGIGKFAEDRARATLGGRDIAIARVLHPSPASPVANRGWAAQAEAQLAPWL